MYLQQRIRHISPLTHEKDSPKPSFPGRVLSTWITRKHQGIASYLCSLPDLLPFAIHMALDV